MSDLMTSPVRNNEREPTVPWTIDNSESRISQAISSPIRSILKETQTPDPYSSQHSRQKAPRYHQLINRRVSFASDARVRFYGKNETPNSPSLRTLNQRVHTNLSDENNNEDNDNDKPYSTVFDAETSSPSVNQTDNVYLSRLSGSPMDRRKRRVDMFGSPPGHREQHKQTQVIYPENRVRGMRQWDEDDDETPQNNYFMQFLSQDKQRGPKRLFDDDDDNDINNNDKKYKGENDFFISSSFSNHYDSTTKVPTTPQSTQDATESTTIPNVSKVSTLPSTTLPISSSSNEPSIFTNDKKANPYMNNNDEKDDHTYQHQITTKSSRLSTLTNSQEDTNNMPLPPFTSNPSRRLSDHSTMDDTGIMPLTLQQEEETTRQAMSPMEETMELWPTTAITSGLPDQRRTTLQQQQQHSSNNSVPASNKEHVLSGQLTSQNESQETADMKLTLESIPTNRLHSTPNRQSVYHDNYSSFVGTSSPPSRSPMRSPYTSTRKVNNDTAKSPRVGMSVLESMDASPILPRRQSSHSALLSDRLPPPRSLHQRQQEPFSPQRSFYLHDEAQAYSPARSVDPTSPGQASSIRRTHHLQPSPLRREDVPGPEETDHSIGSDYGDRMISMHGNDNIDLFEEELPQLYDSFVEDVPSSKSMTLSKFLESAGVDFAENVPVPTQRNEADVPLNKDPARFDEQATAAACTLPELEAYRKLAQRLEDLIKELSNRLKILDDDLSENNPQIFAEYRDATAEICQQMEEQFEQSKALAHAEAEHEWIKWQISITKDLINLFTSHLDRQKKDQDLLKQMEDHINSNFPQLLAHRYELTKATEEAREREKTYQEMDHGLIVRWERDIRDQEMVIENSRQQVSDLKDQETDTLKKLTLLEERKKELLEAIAKAEATRDAHPYVSDRDMIDAKDQYDACSEICGWKLKQKTEDIMEFIIYDDLNVLINTQKLYNHEVDAVFIGMLESRDRDYGPFAELVHGLQLMAKGTWKQEEIMQVISIYWNRLRMIRKEVTMVKRRFWIELETLTQDPFADTDMRGVKCQITVFSYMQKLKFQVIFNIRAKQIMAYPHSLDLSSLTVLLQYGDTSSEILGNLVRQKLKKNGIVNLVDTLCEVIDDYR
ncbi:Spc7 kinetochore protein-domain-containing protein [Halteromyces radiatus]|uniref:Spc7 kinetochore protein-domain-containing protein n=1 Tax=Halteromyces radiatus TaxID=101107 RepID=UPI00221F5C2C|nr:Spc7 kinetochore protein-domain-containing protein [Halteromyces radiatus]KAI8082961.1 Spc7 kinetochore protein-domain-containing protein [Halteromyces radiatus]